MYTKDQLNDLYERIVKTIDISNEMFDVAEKRIYRFRKLDRPSNTTI